MFGTDGPVVNMIFGMEEASVMGTALGVYIATVETRLADIDTDTEDGHEEFLAWLSVKFAASEMYGAIWSLLGMPDEAIDAALDAMADKPEATVSAEHDERGGAS